MLPKKIVAVVLALAFISMPFGLASVISADDDGPNLAFAEDRTVVGEFVMGSNGRITVVIESTFDSPVSAFVYVTRLGDTGHLAEATDTVPGMVGDDNGSKEFTFNFILDPVGTQTVTVTAVYSVGSEEFTISTDISVEVVEAASERELKIVSEDIEIGSFVQGSNGSITLVIENPSGTDIPATVYVTFLNSTDRLAETSVNVPAKIGDENGTAECVLTFKIGSSGSHWVEVTVAYNAGSGDIITSSGSLEIEVASSIWSNSSTYIVIVLVVLVIAVAIWLRLRNPSKKKDIAAGTFTAMESQRRAVKEKKEEPEEDEDDYDDDLEDEEEEPVAVTKAPVKKESAAKKDTAKKEYTGRATSTKKKQASPQRKSSSSNKRAKRK